MKVGSLVIHKGYFGVGIVTDIKEVNGKTQWLIHWLRLGKDTGWAWVDNGGVEVLCK